jgi:carboxymethylenebutenolidase
MLHLKRPEGAEPEDFHLSRRGLAGAIMFAGYAAYALGADADPIHTDEVGLVTETAMLPTAGGSIRGYIARPDGHGRYPAVMVASEIFGLHEYIRDVCRRLAKLGYVAIAPGFFDRAGDPAPLTDFKAIMQIVRAAGNEQVLADVGVTLQFLEAQPYVEPRKLVITGFCWGGGVVWKACETYPDFKAGVSWYGPLAPAPDAPNPAAAFWPIDHVADLHCPVLGLYGGKDALSAAVPAMREALAKAGKTDYRPSYVAADAEDGWSRMLAFFAANGVLPRRR